jgi:hypothetical protein
MWLRSENGVENISSPFFAMLKFEAVFVAAENSQDFDIIGEGIGW